MFGVYIDRHHRNKLDSYNYIWYDIISEETVKEEKAKEKNFKEKKHRKGFDRKIISHIMNKSIVF